MEARELFEILMREQSQSLLAYIRSAVRDPFGGRHLAGNHAGGLAQAG